MRKKPILVDVDGVCADFMGAVLDFTNTRFDTDYKHSDMYDDFRVVIGKHHDDELEKFIKSKGFCQMLNVLPGSQEGVEALREAGHDVMFVTSPYRDAPTWGHDRTKWLERHFGVDRDSVILTRTKKYVDGLTLIDDLPRNCSEWAEYQQTPATLFVKPWNKKDISEMIASHCNVANGWDEVLEILL